MSKSPFVNTCVCFPFWWIRLRQAWLQKDYSMEKINLELVECFSSMKKALTYSLYSELLHKVRQRLTSQLIGSSSSPVHSIPSPRLTLQPLLILWRKSSWFKLNSWAYTHHFPISGFEGWNGKLKVANNRRYSEKLSMMLEEISHHLYQNYLWRSSYTQTPPHLFSRWKLGKKPSQIHKYSDPSIIKKLHFSFHPVVDCLFT